MAREIHYIDTSKVFKTYAGTWCDLLVTLSDTKGDGVTAIRRLVTCVVCKALAGIK